MNDYFSAAAGLSAGRSFASTMISPGDPLVSLLSAVPAHPSHALLGALFEAHLAETTGHQEMKSIRNALDLWTELRGILAELRSARSSLEGGVTEPANTSKADAALIAILSVRDKVLPQITEWTQSAAAFLQDPKLLDYLPRSGMAADSNPKTWQWPELAMLRRTGALRHEFLKAAAGPKGTAFALGAASSYATQLTMGSWRNAVVGGPPRSHPVRSRLVARTSGAWLRAYFPGITPSISDLQWQLETGVGTTLPAELADQISKAMTATYESNLPGKMLPDFKKAYRSMLRHLEILDQLRFWIEGPAGQPAVPVISPPKPPPIVVLVQAAALVPGGMGGSAPGQGGMIQIQAGAGLGGGPAGTNAKAQSYTGKTGAQWWKQVLAVAVTIILGIVLGIVGAVITAPGLVTIIGGAAGGASVGVSLGVAFGEWTGAWKENSYDTYVQAQQALSAPEAGAVCKELFDLDVMLYTAASQFLTVLKGAGLAYPETPDLATPPFKELLTVQSRHIHRPMNAPDSFAAYPTSPIELATTFTQTPDWPYGPGAQPIAAIEEPMSKLAPVTAASLSLTLWRDLFHGSQLLSQNNYNLEADRGFIMPCWEGVTQVQPVTIKLLPFGAI